MVIALLSAALVGPHVVDWDSHRGQIEKRLSHTLGVPVTSSGPIKVTLLPTPSLSLRDVAIGRPETSHASMASLDGALSLTALLRGKIEITAMAVEKPAITIVTRPDGSIAGLPQIRSRIAPEDVSIDRIGIAQGSVTVIRPGQSSLDLTDLYVDAEAASLAGPFRGRSRFLTAEGRRNFSFASGKFEGGKLRMKALIEDGAHAIRYDLDGQVTPFPTAADKGRIYEGQFGASGNFALPRDNGFAQVLWHLQGPATATASAIQIDNLELTLGNDSDAVKFSGLAEKHFGAGQDTNIILSTKQIDLDRLLSNDSKQPTEHRPSEALAFAASLAKGLKLPGVAGPGRLRFDLSAGTVLLGGDRMIGVSANGTLQNGVIALAQLSGEAPGDTAITASGVLEDRGGARFVGKVGLEARDARRLIRWYSGVQDIPIRKVAGELAVDVSPERLALDASELRIDDGRISGHFERRAIGFSGVPAIKAKLSGSGLPLEMGRILLPGGTRDDLDLDLDLSNIRVGALSAGRVKLHATRSPAGLVLDNVDIADLAGLAIKGRSSLGQVGGGLYAEIDARNLDGVADVFARLGYPAVAAAIQHRAPALNAVKAVVRGDSRLDNGTFMNALQIEGATGQTKLQGSMRWSTPQGSDWGLPESGIVADLSLNSPNSAELLAQLGPETLRIDAGPGRLHLAVQGELRKALSVKATGLLAGLKLSLEGRMTPTDLFKPFEGTFSLETANLAVATRAMAIAYPPVPEGFAASVKGRALFSGGKLTLGGLDGHLGKDALRGELAIDFLRDERIKGELSLGSVDARLLAAIVLGPDYALFQKGGWDKRGFGVPQTPPFFGDVWIETPKLWLSDDTALDKAGFVYRFENGFVGFENLQALSGSGWIKGDLGLRRSDNKVSADLHLGSDGLKLPFGGGRGALSGQLAGKFSASGVGTSLADLVASLAGSGTFRHTGIAVADLDPEALRRTLAAFAGADGQPEPEAINARFAQEAQRGAMALPSGEVGATLAQGVLRLSPVTMPGEKGEVELTLAADIAKLRLDARAEYRLATQPEGWAGRPPSATVSWTGPLLAPARAVDTTVLTNGLAAIAIARDLERIQIFEQDARERAFFVRRQRASDEERARLEAEKRKVEEAKRQQEERIKAAEEARLKAEQDAKRQAQEAAERAARQAAEQAAARQKAEDAARQRAEDAKRKAEQDAKRQAQEAAEQAAARQKADAEALRLKAEEAARQQAEEAKRKAEDAARRQAAERKREAEKQQPAATGAAPHVDSPAPATLPVPAPAPAPAPAPVPAPAAAPAVPLPPRTPVRDPNPRGLPPPLDLSPGGVNPR